MGAKEEKAKEIEKSNIKAKSKMTKAEKEKIKKDKAKEFNAAAAGKVGAWHPVGSVYSYALTLTVPDSMLARLLRAQAASSACTCPNPVVILFSFPLAEEEGMRDGLY